MELEGSPICTQVYLLDDILSQLNIANIPTLYFCKMHSNIIVAILLIKLLPTDSSHYKLKTHVYPVIRPGKRPCLSVRHYERFCKKHMLYGEKSSVPFCSSPKKH
jgi:hypothetical protein